MMKIRNNFVYLSLEISVNLFFALIPLLIIIISFFEEAILIQI